MHHEARIALCVCTAVLLVSCGERSGSAARAPTGEQLAAALAAQRERDERAAATRMCNETLRTKQAEYNRLQGAKRHYEAAAQLSDCARVLESAELKAQVRQAELHGHLQVLESPRGSPKEELNAAQSLLRDFPERGKKYEPLIPRLDAQVESLVQSEIAAERRAQGVRIGMAPHEVVASSWGKPQRINRTTSASGVREQWVYANGNYLYFEDGLLATISTRTP
jgi:hypothetical protein